MKSFNVTAAFLLLGVLIACNRNSEDKMTLPEVKQEANAALIENEQAGNFTADSTGIPDQKEKTKQPRPDKQPLPDWDKKIIRSATLELEVKDANAYYKNLREQVRSYGGYVAQEDQEESDYKLENNLVIKVPVAQFDLAVAGLTENAEKVQQRNIRSEDVTGEIVDTRSRLEAKKQVRLRYLELLNQAHNMTDILNVQQEINGIQEEIEAATGRVQWLGNAAAFSTINLTYYQVINATAKDVTPSFGSRILASFKFGGQWVLELLIGLVAVWPLIAAGVVAAILGKRILRKKKVVSH